MPGPTLQVKIGADARAFYREMGMVARHAGAVGKGVAAGLAGGVAAMGAAWGAALKGLVDYGSALTDLSAQTGLSTDTLQELGYAAKLTGADMTDLGPAVKGLASALQAAGTKGGKSARNAFQALGLSWKELAASSPDQQLTAVLAALGRMEDPTKRNALATDLLGKAGMKLMPMAASMTQLANEARQLGLVLKPETIAQADALGDAMDTLGARLKGAGFAAVAPDLQRITDAVTAITKDPAVWGAIAPGIRQVAAAFADMGVSMAKALQDKETLTQLEEFLTGVGNGFRLAGDGAEKLLKVLTPLLWTMNQLRDLAAAGFGGVFGAAAAADANRLARVEQFSPELQTQAALNLRERGITPSMEAGRYQGEMLVELRRIANAVTPMAQEK